MYDSYNLERFIKAQENTYEQALKEIKTGKKNNHWMSYIFPQIEGLAHSSMSKRFSIKSKEEAIVYLNHKVLGARLLEISNALLKLYEKSAYNIFGTPDNLKLKSNMSLFSIVSVDNNLFTSILKKYFEGEMCKIMIIFLIRNLKELIFFFFNEYTVLPSFFTL